MSLPKSDLLYTVEEYLARERAAEERHEYLDGLIYAMAGESEEHGFICVNLTRIISACLRGHSCVVFSKDMKVRSGPAPIALHAIKGLFSYPDLVIVCGERQYHDEYRDVLLNPTMIIEVLSPSTEAYDRGRKFWRYRSYNPTLTDYLLVSQSVALIEYYQRQDSNRWELSSVEGLDGSLELASIGCTLRLSEVYEGVIFPAEAPGGPDQ
jgi:Uma2 family endonuclease